MQRCSNTRDWDRLCEVFTDDVHMDFAAWKADGLDAVRDNIRPYLDGCGPSQHLLGNYRIDFTGDDTATSACYIRVMHHGKGEHEGKHYEMCGEYRDELVRTPEGWRSRKRIARAWMHDGDPSLLVPA